MAENNGENLQDLKNNPDSVDTVAASTEEQLAAPQVTETKSDNELLDMVFTLESEKQQLVEESRKRIGALRRDLEVSFCFLVSYVFYDGKQISSHPSLIID